MSAAAHEMDAPAENIDASQSTPGDASASNETTGPETDAAAAASEQHQESNAENYNEQPAEQDEHHVEQSEQHAEQGDQYAEQSNPAESNEHGTTTEAGDQPEGPEEELDDANLTFELSSPGGEAPISDARHTKLSVNEEIPNFAGFSQLGRIQFHDYIAGGWSLLVTFARSFDPVSMTEIGRLAKLRSNFEARSINILGVLQDSVLMVSKYLQDVARIEQVDVNFPVIADDNKSVAKLLGVWNDEESVALACVYVMGPFKRIRFRLSCQQDVGRNFYEVLRIIDALNVNDEVGCSAPANWSYGEEVRDFTFDRRINVLRPHLSIADVSSRRSSSTLL